MHYDLLVEISDEMDSDLLDRLLAAAYRASRSRKVGLILRDTTREAVDRRLDPIVEAEGTSVNGVRYLGADELQSALEDRGAGDVLLLSRDPKSLPIPGASPSRIRDPEDGLALLEDRATEGTAA